MDGSGREDLGWDRWIPGSAGVLARVDHGGVREPAGWKPALPGVWQSRKARAHGPKSVRTQEGAR